MCIVISLVYEYTSFKLNLKLVYSYTNDIKFNNNIKYVFIALVLTFCTGHSTIRYCNS